MKSIILIFINVLLIIANLILFNYISIIVLDLDPARCLKYLTHSHKFTLGKDEISLPSGYYVAGKELEGGSEITIAEDLEMSTLSIDHYPLVKNCEDSLTYEKIRMMFSIQIKEASYYSHAVNRHYIFDESDIYITMRTKPIFPLGFVDIYCALIPDICVKIYLTGIDIPESQFFDYLEYIAFHDREGDFEFIDED